VMISCVVSAASTSADNLSLASLNGIELMGRF
jgi:hypothetical protein